MLDKILQTPTFRTANGALNGLAARHTAISDNISNVNTPGYKRKDVPFEAALRRSMERTLSSVTVPAGMNRPFEPAVVRDTGSMARTDGNNVDIEREMALLAENTLRYETLTQYMTGFFSGLKAVINAR